MCSSPSVTELARNFADYVARVAFRGEHFALMLGRAVAELRPDPAGMRRGDLPGLLASLPRPGPEGAPAFDGALNTARDQIGKLPERDACRGCGTFDQARPASAWT